MDKSRLSLVIHVIRNSKALESEKYPRLIIAPPESKGLLLYKLCEYYTILESPDSSPMEAVFRIIESCQSLKELEIMYKYCVKVEKSVDFGIERPMPHLHAIDGIKIIFSAFANQNIYAEKSDGFWKSLLSQFNNKPEFFKVNEKLEKFNQLLIEVIDKNIAARDLESKVIDCGAHLAVATICQAPTENALKDNSSVYKLLTLKLMIKQMTGLKPLKLTQDIIDIEQVQLDEELAQQQLKKYFEMPLKGLKASR
ncbi:hypothetical protein GW537_11120 [Piscirickettsia salmonis]|uniref:hypothetical protein n=1 Tax=Piscirickettsia salmonis TaxID=1238 RepID=UPI001187629F|nr:hypothetical protein [Piscirickettsia salmonis]QHS26339.1 hypothetical protein GW538_10975 [Piscirickettsia salmonis]QHS29545.1 hypothetical protein GW537_11120 [Piscirickettsia salmonis]